MPIRYEGGSAAPEQETVIVSGVETVVVSTPSLNTNTEVGGQDVIPGFTFWSGIKAQYDALAARDAETIYYITDE